MRRWVTAAATLTPHRKPSLQNSRQPQRGQSRQRATRSTLIRPRRHHRRGRDDSRPNPSYKDYTSLQLHGSKRRIRRLPPPTSTRPSGERSRRRRSRKRFRLSVAYLFTVERRGTGGGTNLVGRSQGVCVTLCVKSVGCTKFVPIPSTFPATLQSDWEGTTFWASQYGNGHLHL